MKLKGHPLKLITLLLCLPLLAAEADKPKGGPLNTEEALRVEAISAKIENSRLQIQLLQRQQSDVLEAACKRYGLSQADCTVEATAEGLMVKAKTVPPTKPAAPVDSKPAK